MNKSLKNALCVFVILAAAVALSACGNAATPEPTPDMNAFATSAVETVEARYTETAIAMPTETPAPTYTPVSLPTATAEVLVLPTSEELISNTSGTTGTGTTTWTTDYSMRYFTGTNFTKPGKTYYRLNAAVAPNETGACSMDAVAPTTPGTYTMSAVLANENDENFMIVDITIVVD